MGSVAMRLAGLVVLAVMCATLSACGHDSARSPDLFAYDPDRPLDVATGDVERNGDVTVRHVTYAGADGARVPALLAIPRDEDMRRGCLIFQGGLGSRKEDAGALWPGAAKLGLATFTIDARDQGERARNPSALRADLESPKRLADMLRGTVIDLRRGLDYLETVPECQGKFVYIGVSEGGALGAMLAGSDDRIDATALLSVGSSWRAAIRTSDVILPGIERDPSRLKAALEDLGPLDPARWVAEDRAPAPVPGRRPKRPLHLGGGWSCAGGGGTRAETVLQLRRRA